METWNNYSLPANETILQNETFVALDETVGKLIRKFDIGIRIFIIVLGTIGNCLSVVIFCSKHLRHLSSSLYLAALAVSDTAFLIVLLVNWLQGVGFDILLDDICCRLQVYLSNVFGFLSVWFVVAFTVERFIAVQYPLMRPSMCTVSRAKAVICGLFIFSLLLFIPYLGIVFEIVAHENIRYCLESELTSLDSAMNSMDTALVMVVPCVAIVSINTCICLTVHRLSRRRRRMTLNGGRRLQDPSRLQQPSHSSNSSQNKVTRLLLVVSTVFVCLNFPSYVSRLMLYIPALQEIWDNLTFRVLQRVSMWLYYTTFGINFFLYCLTGQNFRKSLIGLLYPQSMRQQETTRVTVVSEIGRTSSTRRRTITLNGSLTEAHEMLPLNG